MCPKGVKDVVKAVRNQLKGPIRKKNRDEIKKEKKKSNHDHDSVIMMIPMETPRKDRGKMRGLNDGKGANDAIHNRGIVYNWHDKRKEHI